MRAAILAPLILLAAASTARSAQAPRALTDADLVAYAAKPYDKAAMMFHHVPLGLHHGALVVADFPCGDLCPDYTRRIIHYDLAPGPACAKAGGVVEMRGVPAGIAMTETAFCVPAVLKGKP
jgi:hypothetical protein